MKRSARFLASAAAILAIAATIASPASATANHEIEFTGPIITEAGRGAVFYAEGQVAPPAEFWDESWILAVAIPASVMAECPADASSAGTVGEQAGAIIAIAMNPAADETGHFANVIGYTPPAPGPLLICAYLYNEVGSTWAGAGMRVEVVGGGAPGGGSTGTVPGPSGGTGGRAGPTGPPLNTSRPWVSSTRRVLVCHPGTWSNVTGGYSIRWLFDRRPTKVTGPTAVNRRGNRGHKASCRVTAYGPGGSTATAVSPPFRLR
jgi:hypothetical protein